jgi:peptidoglycan/xylan/chitin deacetylase (PgdA/CDA1 family)
MKAIVLKEYGDVSNLVLADLLLPAIRPDEVLIEVKAIGINPADTYIRRDKNLDYIFNGERPRDIPGWRTAHQKGHELGNHTVYHPCLSSVFKADPHYQAENYSVANIVREISTMNTLLYALDNQPRHPYAYPCGETTAGGISYVDSLRKAGFVSYARGGGANPIITNFKRLDPFLVPCMGFETNATATDLVDFVKRVLESKGMGVFIFHGVGGDYLEVSAAAHQQLVQYLKEHRQQIWVTTFTEAMKYVTTHAR